MLCSFIVCLILIYILPKSWYIIENSGELYDIYITERMLIKWRSVRRDNRDGVCLCNFISRRVEYYLIQITRKEDKGRHRVWNNNQSFVIGGILVENLEAKEEGWRDERVILKRKSQKSTVIYSFGGSSWVSRGNSFDPRDLICLELLLEERFKKHQVTGKDFKRKLSLDTQIWLIKGSLSVVWTGRSMAYMAETNGAKRSKLDEETRVSSVSLVNLLF